MHNHFNFGLKELSSYGVRIKAPLIRHLYDEISEKFPEAQWAQLVVKCNEELKRAIIESGNGDDSDHLKDFKVSLSDVFVANYWDEVKDYLILGGGLVNHCLCQRFVKNFHSVGTLEQFLEF